MLRQSLDKDFYKDWTCKNCGTEHYIRWQIPASHKRVEADGEILVHPMMLIKLSISKELIDATK